MQHDRSSTDINTFLQRNKALWHSPRHSADRQTMHALFVKESMKQRIERHHTEKVICKAAVSDSDVCCEGGQRASEATA